MSAPAFDDETERAVIGAWISDARFQLGWCPEPELFLARPHRLIVELLAARHGRDDYDVTALVLDARRDPKRLEQLGGAGELEDLVVSAPFCRDPWAAVEQLRRFRAHQQLRRRIADALREADAGASFTDTQTAVSEALQATMLGAGARPVSLRDALLEVAIEATKPLDDSARIWTRIARVDRATGGHYERGLWTIGMFTNVGKSSWCSYVADQALQQGHHPLVITLEDDVRLYAKKFLLLRAKLNAWRLREHRLGPEEHRAALRVAQAAPDVPMFIDGRELGSRVEAIAGAIRSLCASSGIDFVLLDYAQKLEVEKKCDSRRDELAYAGRILTDAIKRAAPMGGIIFSQLTGDSSQRPTRDQVRDCRDLAHGAETIMLGYKNKGGDPIAVIDKVKEGPTGFEIPLPWDPDGAHFETEIEDDSQVPLYRDYDDEGDAA